MTAPASNAAPPPAQSAPISTHHQPVYRDIGRFSGCRGRHAERAGWSASGLPDLRGALGFGFDEAFLDSDCAEHGDDVQRCLCCLRERLFGPRRILLPAAAVFTVTSALLPFAPNYWAMLVCR